MTGYPPRDLLDRAELHRCGARGARRAGGDDGRDDADLRLPHAQPRVVRQAAAQRGHRGPGRQGPARAAQDRSCRRTTSSTSCATSSRDAACAWSRSPATASASRSARTSGSTTRSSARSSTAAIRSTSWRARAREVFLNISASPFNAGKRRARWEIFSRIAKRYDVPLVYVNQVGGNDELLFDGSSIVIDKTGQTIFCAPAFEEHGSLVQLQGSPCEIGARPSARRKRSAAR